MDNTIFLNENAVEKKTIQASDLDKVREEIKETENSDKPYLAIDDENQMFAIGNPNNTEVEKEDYEVEFEFPLTYKEQLPDAIERNGELIYKITVKEAYSTPRKRLRLMQAWGQVLSYITKVEKDGKVEYGTHEYYIKMLENMSNEVADAFYDVVAIFLGIKDEYRDRMSVKSVMENIGKMVKKNPRFDKRK